MSSAVLDACCVIDLYASGQLGPVLAAAGLTWLLPAAVFKEVRYVNQPDAEDPRRLVATPVDLSPYLASGRLTACDVEGDEESELFVQLAVRFRSDGEAMALAIAKSRGCTLATDDRKARRVAGELGVAVLTTAELVKKWAEATGAADAEVAVALRSIQTCARFVPHKTMPLHKWWVGLVSRTSKG